MVSKETFVNGQDTLVGLDAKEVLEFLSSRNKGCGYYLVPDYINCGFYCGIPEGTANFDVIHFNDRNSYSKGHIHIEFDYIQPSVRGNIKNLITYKLTAGKIKKSAIYLEDEYLDEIFKE